MKCLLLLLFPVFVNAQRYDSLILIRSYSIVSANENYIQFNSDSTIEIHGDTIKCITLLFQEYSKMADKFYAANGVLNRLNLPYLIKFLNDKYFTKAVKDYNKKLRL